MSTLITPKFPVAVLLATYNGEKHLPELLDSLISQSYTKFVVIAHDDGSYDGTLALLQEYEKRFPDNFLILKDNIRCGGAKDNFTHLIRSVDFDYAFFCDQDDVWDENKLQEHMQLLCQQSSEVPCVVYSDLKVVDEELNVISESMWEFQNTGPHLTLDIKKLACRNPITGCAMAFNKAAASLYRTSDTSDILMHDWWMALLVTKRSGKLIPIEKPLLMYRQHGCNEVGAQKFSLRVISGKLFNTKDFLESQLIVYRMSRKLAIYRNFLDFIIWKIRSML